MAAHTYHFTDHWSLSGVGPAEIWPVVADSRLLPVWWKGVFLASEKTHGGAEPQVNDRARVKVRGFLPYVLDFEMVTTALEPGELVEVRTIGDFEGCWRMVLQPRESGTLIDIDWTVDVHKRVVRLLSPVLKPLFRRNHEWSAIRGEDGLRSYFAEHRNAVGPRPIRRTT